MRGELDEARTECQAVQRSYRAARMRGVPEVIAKCNALEYYTGYYRPRAAYGPMQPEYCSDECAPGKAWDERLGDSSWGP